MVSVLLRDSVSPGFSSANSCMAINPGHLIAALFISQFTPLHFALVDLQRLK